MIILKILYILLKINEKLRNNHSLPDDHINICQRLTRMLLSLPLRMSPKSLTATC
jgi:hypothetical protein